MDTHYYATHYLDDDWESSGDTLVSRCFKLKYDFYQWTRQRIHDNLIMVDQYLQLMEAKTIPDSVGGLPWNRFIHPIVADQVLIYHT